MRTSKYKDIGKNGTAERFLQALKRIAGARFLYTSTNHKLNALFDGAVAAFHADRPENIRSALQDLKVTDFGSCLGKASYPFHVADLLYKLTEKSFDKQVVIDCAFAKMPEKKRKEVLSQALHGAVILGGVIGDNRRFGEESFIASLLQSGADANAGQPGIILANAAYGCPMPVIKLLCESGARLDDAFSLMQGGGYADGIDKLRAYQKMATDEQRPPVVAAADSWRQQMEEQIADLTQEVERLKALIPGASQLQEETKPPQKPRRSSEHLKNF